jgi:hypothetical protein
VVGDADDARARATLNAMQALLATSPHDALGLLPDATPGEIRSAFLELTKIYHPAKFSRMSPDVQYLSNEVFLALRGAHDSAAKAAAPGPAPRNARSTGMPPMHASGTGPLRADGSAGMQPPPPPPQPMTQPPTVRLSQAVRATAGSSQPMVGSSQSTTAKLPVVRPTEARPGSRSDPNFNRGVPAQPQPASTTGSTRPPTPQPTPVAARTATPTHLGRPGTPPQRALTPATGIKTTQPMPVVARAGSPPAAATQPPPRDADFNEAGELRVIKELVSRMQWSEAVQALTRLVNHVPTSKPHRARLAYVRAREAEAAGRINDAIAEAQRALEIDPELGLAKTMLAELRSKRR